MAEQKLDDLSSLVDMRDPMAVYAEVRAIVSEACPEMDFTRLDRVYEYVIGLFNGRVEGFKRCSTEYHDIKHTTDVFLAYGRKLHALWLAGRHSAVALAELGLAGAAMHDIGYIQCSDDDEGTGAKFAQVHVDRSMEMARRWMPANGFSQDEADACARMIKATDMSVRLDSLPFRDDGEAQAARELFVADLMGQMSDRVYLEKLLFLYREFSEAHVMGFESEEDLLEKTVGFYDMILKRLDSEAGYDESVMRAHFRTRHAIDSDLYMKAMRNNVLYLKNVLSRADRDYRSELKREGLVQRLEELEKIERGLEN